MVQLPGHEDNPGNNQQQQNQATTRTVTVKVYKKGTEEAIGSANIMIGTISGQTGINGGLASLSNVPDGTQTITVTADGYKTYTESIEVSASTNSFDIYLEEEE